MSSDLFVFDGSFYQHSSSDLLFDDQLCPFSDTAIDILQALCDHTTQQNPGGEPQSVEHICSSIPSSSSPSNQLENLSLYQTTNQLQHVTNSPNSAINGFENLSGLDVKTEKFHMGLENTYGTQAFVPHSYSCAENVARMMQSCDSNFFNGKPDFLTHSQPGFNTLTKSQSFQNQTLNSPEYNNFLSGQMRKVFSAGNLQNFNFRETHTTQRSLSSSLVSESSFVDETNFKVGKYSAEERKEKISKYRAKRTHRNFSKTIKYACRKILADNRPRIRGRFARNEETGEIPKAPSSTRDLHEDYYELWMGSGAHIEEEEEEENGTVMRGQFVNSYICPTSTQFQYYGLLN